MLVVDTFPFSEAYERELLLLKLHLEAPYVDHWVITECAWTFQGDYKGTCLHGILNDAAFNAFRERIHVVSTPHRLHHGPNEEGHNFQCEHLQRELAFGVLQELCREGDRVIVSDVDEAFDFENPEKITALLPAMESGEPVFHVKRKRFWWDFDNECIPEFTIPVVRWPGNAHHQILRARWLDPTPWVSCDYSPMAFEYSFCFAEAHLWRKLTTFSHNGYDPEELNVALLTNSWQKCKARGEVMTDDPKNWFRKVELTERNSPAYVRENLERLRTGNVDPDYERNRVLHFPQFFPAEIE